MKTPATILIWFAPKKTSRAALNNPNPKEMKAPNLKSLIGLKIRTSPRIERHTRVKRSKDEGRPVSFKEKR